MPYASRANYTQPRGPRRDGGAPQPRRDAQPAVPPAKAQSYLAFVKTQLAFLLEDLAIVAAGDGPNAAAALWPFVSSAVTKSYWNGVENGANGTAKPKARRGPADAPAAEGG